MNTQSRCDWYADGIQLSISLEGRTPDGPLVIEILPTSPNVVEKTLVLRNLASLVFQKAGYAIVASNGSHEGMTVFRMTQAGDSRPLFAVLKPVMTTLMNQADAEGFENTLHRLTESYPRLSHASSADKGRSGR